MPAVQRKPARPTASSAESAPRHFQTQTLRGCARSYKQATARSVRAPTRQSLNQCSTSRTVYVSCLFYSDLNDIPRRAGEHFGFARVYRNIVLDADAADAGNVHSRLDGDDVSGFQFLLLPFRDARVLVNFNSEPMPRAVGEVTVKPVTGQNLPGSSVHFPAGYARAHGRNGRRSSFLHRFVPAANLGRRFAHDYGSGNVAAIVREYSTHVEHDQFVFLQSFIGRSRMWKRRAFSECHDCFKGRTGGSEQPHLVFDLRGNL